MAELTQDRRGHPWKAYSNGRVLCAASEPYHDPYSEEEGCCDCLEIEGETIAVFHWTPEGMVPHKMPPSKGTRKIFRDDGREVIRAARGEKTPNEAFYDPIKKVLADGQLRCAEAIDRVGRLMELNDVDKAVLKSGEVRWRNTCRWARTRLMENGVLDDNAPHGWWRLSK